MRRMRALLLLGIVFAQTPRDPGKRDAYVDEAHQGSSFSCLNGLTKCPDQGRYRSAGGNVTLTILEMKNLPDMDGYGLAGLETDAFIKVTMESNGDERISGVIDNSLNPSWPPCAEKHCLGKDDILRDLNFGYRKAGQRMIVDVYDYDSGLEFGHDWIATIPVNVIYCSAFTARVQQTPNEEEDGVWKMPEQPLCVEEAWFPFVAGGECFDANGHPTAVPCMKLRQTVIPFQMRVEEVYLRDAVVNGGMAGFYDESMPWVYGRVYSDSAGDRLEPYQRLKDAIGGLLVRFGSLTNNEHGNTTLIPEFGFAPYARFTCNYDADMYVFRRKTDFELKPEWLLKPHWEESDFQARLVGVNDFFRAVKRPIQAHPINRYGDSLGGGEITGMNIRQDDRDTTAQMYFVILVPHESQDPIPPQYSKAFGAVEFLLSFLQFGLLYLLFSFWTWTYLRKVHWRSVRALSGPKAALLPGRSTYRSTP